MTAYHMDQHCKDCGVPMERDEEQCSCNESLCAHCCQCGDGCGCACDKK